MKLVGNEVQVLHQDNDPEYYPETEQYVSRYHMTNVGDKELGTYECIATNKVDSSSAQMQLSRNIRALSFDELSTALEDLSPFCCIHSSSQSLHSRSRFIGVPDPVSGVRVSNVSTTSAELEWQRGSDGGDARHFEFLLEYAEIVGGRRGQLSYSLPIPSRRPRPDASPAEKLNNLVVYPLKGTRVYEIRSHGVDMVYTFSYEEYCTYEMQVLYMYSNGLVCRFAIQQRVRDHCNCEQLSWQVGAIQINTFYN